MAEKVKEKKQKPITDFIKKKEEKSKIEKSLCEDEADAEYWKSLGKTFIENYKLLVKLNELK